MHSHCAGRNKENQKVCHIEKNERNLPRWLKLSNMQSNKMIDPRRETVHRWRAASNWMEWMMFPHISSQVTRRTSSFLVGPPATGPEGDNDTRLWCLLTLLRTERLLPSLSTSPLAIS